MKKFDLKQDSINLGKTPSYFSVMKKVNPVAFRFCCFYSKRSLIEGYNKLILYYENLKNFIQDVYFSFEYPYAFSKWLVLNKIYKTNGAAYSINFIFNQTDIIRQDCIKRLKKIKKLWLDKND